MRHPITARHSRTQPTRNLTARGLVGTMVTFGLLLAAIFAPVLTVTAVGSVVVVAHLLTRLVPFQTGSGPQSSITVSWPSDLYS